MTRTHIVRSLSGDFTDAQVVSFPYYVIQIGADYYAYNIDTGVVEEGPESYADAFGELIYGVSAYRAFVNEIFHLDNGEVSTSTFELLQAVGPFASSRYACEP